MFSHLTPIIAQVNNPTQIEKLSGEGIVEKKIDDHTYIIRFSSGKVNVTLTSGSLTPQTKVRIKEQGNQVIIIPVYPQKNSTDQIEILQKIPTDRIKIDFSEKHPEDCSKNIVQSLLSIVSQTYSESDSDEVIKHYKIIADKIAAEIQNNPEFFNSNKELKNLGEKIINALTHTTKNRESISEIRDIIRAFETRLVELSEEKQKSMVLPQTVESGFSYFPTGKDAIEWLIQTQPSLDKNYLYQLFLSKSDPVIIQTITDTHGTTVLFLMNKDESINLFDSYIHKDFKNHLWETLPADLFLSVLKFKGSVTNVTIDSIDRILQSISNNHHMGKALLSNGNGAKDLIQQWIALMLENPETLKHISKQFPVDAAEDFGRNLELLLTKLPVHSPLRSNIIEDVLTNTVKNSDISKTESIAHAFDRMGYSFENTLFQSSQMESPLKEEIFNSIKSQLYSLLPPQMELDDNIPIISRSTSNDNPVLIALTQMKNLTFQISQLFQPSEFVDMKYPAQKLQSVLEGIHSLVQNYEKNIHKIISNAEEKYIQNIQSFQQGKIDQETVLKSFKSISNSLLSDINRLFNSIIKDIITHIERSTEDQDKSAQQITRRITRLISGIKQNMGQLARNIEQNIDPYISQGEKNIQSTLPESMRQQVEAMLSRFESLQLLSKPIPTVDGQQQVLSFPVKFGEEWTDVKILLIKKKNKKKNKANQNNYTVRMHVAPSHCGAVNINMEYNLKYKLKVNIEFEKDKSRLWFNKYKEQLIAALKNDGIPSVTLSLVSGLQSTPCKKKSTIPMAPDRDKKNTTIDINV